MADHRTATTAAHSNQGAARPAFGTLWRWLDRVIWRRLRFYGLAVLLDILAVTAAFEFAAVAHSYRWLALASEVRYFLLPSLFLGFLYAAVSYAFGLHRRLWRYADLKDSLALLQALGVTTLIAGAAVLGARFYLPPSTAPAWLSTTPLSVIGTGALLAFMVLGCLKVLPPTIRGVEVFRPGEHATRVLIVGAGQAGAVLAARLLLNTKAGYRIVAFVDDDPAKWRRSIHGRPIFGPTQAIPLIVNRAAIDIIAIALPSAQVERISQILAICQQTPAGIKIFPGLHDMVGDRTPSHLLREVNVAELLGRPVVPLHAFQAQTALAGRTVLVTGAAGSIGSELCRQLISYAPAAVIAVDSNETGLFDLTESLRANPGAERLFARIADVTDERTMTRLFAEQRPQIIYHAAAYKHVPLLEEHPAQAIRTNVLGTYRLCRLAREFGVERFVFVSSDKAVEPTNSYGASKRIGELTIQALAQAEEPVTYFSAVRFGNVIGSRGSVVPLFTQQIDRGGPVTVTDAETTRYFMTIPEACGLVILASVMAENGALYLLDMGQPVRIADLAVRMIRLRGLRVGQDVAIEYTGLRSGERLHERLVAEDERLLSTDHAKIFQVAGGQSVPTVALLESWMRDFDANLRHDDADDVLREHLLQVTRGTAAVSRLAR